MCSLAEGENILCYRSRIAIEGGGWVAEGTRTRDVRERSRTTGMSSDGAGDAALRYGYWSISRRRGLNSPGSTMTP